jgi:hypothetical protein
MIVREFVEELATLATAKAKGSQAAAPWDADWAEQLAACVDLLFTMADANFSSKVTEPEVMDQLYQAISKLARSAPAEWTGQN